jgi:hypothetical protein
MQRWTNRDARPIARRQVRVVPSPEAEPPHGVPIALATIDLAGAAHLLTNVWTCIIMDVYGPDPSAAHAYTALGSRSVSERPAGQHQCRPGHSSGAPSRAAHGASCRADAPPWPGAWSAPGALCRYLSWARHRLCGSARVPHAPPDSPARGRRVAASRTSPRGRQHIVSRFPLGIRQSGQCMHKESTDESLLPLAGSCCRSVQCDYFWCCRATGDPGARQGGWCRPQRRRARC